MTPTSGFVRVRGRISAHALRKTALDSPTLFKKIACHHNINGLAEEIDRPDIATEKPHARRAIIDHVWIDIKSIFPGCIDLIDEVAVSRPNVQNNAISWYEDLKILTDRFPDFLPVTIGRVSTIEIPLMDAG